MTLPYQDGCTDDEKAELNALNERIDALREARQELCSLRERIRQRAVARLRAAERTGGHIRFRAQMPLPLRAPVEEPIEEPIEGPVESPGGPTDAAHAP